VSAAWKQRLFRTRPEDALPITVEHQRVYIVPTKRGFAFLFALLLMLIASINYSLSLGYALCFLLCGLFAATLLHTYSNLAGIRIHAIDSTDCFAGEKARFTVRLSEQGNRPRQGITIRTRAGESTGKFVIGNNTQTIALDISTKARGQIMLGRITIQSDWPLGLWTCWCYLHVPASCLIYPQPEADAPPLPGTTADNPGARPTNNTQGDIGGLRKYQRGDALSLIAWKSAARGLGLQVKMFESSNEHGKTILNLQQTGLVDLEAQLSRLCAWVLQAESQQCEYELSLAGSDTATNSETAQMTRTLQALAMHGQLT
jgi:uncharacterized protein (DUF58 family)